MRRISYWILSTLSALVLLVGFDASQHGAATSGLSSSSVASGTTSSTKTPTPGTPGSQKKTKKTTSRTVSGSVVQTQWGPVQVQLVVTNGSITAVKVLQYPHGNPHDAEINSYALPILVKETTQQQSAAIDMVSGATYTSTGYIQSLQSALDQAHL